MTMEHKYEPTKPLMKAGLIIEAILAFAFPLIVVGIVLSYQVGRLGAAIEGGAIISNILNDLLSAPSSEAGIFLFFGFLTVMVIWAFLAIVYLPMFIINLVLYRKMHHKEMSVNTAGKVYAYHLAYGLVNLLLSNLLLGVIYILIYSKGKNAIESTNVNPTQQSAYLE